MFVSMFSFHSLSPFCPVLRFGSLHRYMRSTFCVPIRRSFAWWILLFCHFGQSCDVVHYARHVNAFTLCCFRVCPSPTHFLTLSCTFVLSTCPTRTHPFAAFDLWSILLRVVACAHDDDHRETVPFYAFISSSFFQASLLFLEFFRLFPPSFPRFDFLV